MHWILYTLFALWLIGGIAMLVLRSLRERRGRRTCTQWSCPQCQQQFGGTFREWRRRQGIMIMSALFTGPVLHCPRCHQDFWFTWTAHRLPAEEMKQGFELAEPESPN
jgi:hypothetical protein